MAARAPTLEFYSSTDDLGAVANYGSNTVSQLVRDDDFISIGRTINLAPGCMNPDSVALTRDHLFVVGTNCAESHAWPWGKVGWNGCQSHRSFGGADRGRQDLGGCHPDVRIRPSTAAHAAWGAQRDEHHRNAPQPMRTSSRSARRSGEIFWDSLPPTVRIASPL